jgi:hypothetical protein
MGRWIPEDRHGERDHSRQRYHRPRRRLDGKRQRADRGLAEEWWAGQTAANYGTDERQLGGWRPATFADPATDITPVTGGSPPVSNPSALELTFQVAPRQSECMGSVAQTPHPSGMLVALVDGSVRTLAPGMSSQTYWGAVTPAGGELLGGDW